MEIKSRHHLRSDDVRAIETRLQERLGVDLDGDQYELVELDGSRFDLVLVDGEPLVLYTDDGDEREPFLTVKGANASSPARGTVTVDAGAIEFVSNGADIMRPGIVEADPEIEPGELVVIVEETHEKALAIGRARTEGADMVGEEGRVVDSLHHVGDELFEFVA